MLNIARIAKFASHKLPGKSSLNDSFVLGGRLYSAASGLFIALVIQIPAVTALAKVNVLLKMSAFCPPFLINEVFTGLFLLL